MARVDGVLPADFDEAPLVESLENRETEFNGLIGALTVVCNQQALNGKLCAKTANADPQIDNGQRKTCVETGLAALP